MWNNDKTAIEKVLNNAVEQLTEMIPQMITSDEIYSLKSIDINICLYPDSSPEMTITKEYNI